MSSFTRTDRVHEDWHRAIHLAYKYAFQLDRRFRVRGIPTRVGWVWKVERVRGRRLTAAEKQRSERNYAAAKGWISAMRVEISRE